MFIELSEFLECPAGHEPTHLVVATGVMSGRDIQHGTIGCPVCEREVLIDGAVARFGPAPPRPPAVPLPPVEDVQAVLGLTGPGGYVVAVGDAARLVAALHARMPGVHFVAVNAPDAVTPAPHVSLLQEAAVIPLKTGMARGVIVGAADAVPRWLAEGARVLLRGQRLVVLTEAVADPPAGVEPTAVGRGMWLASKR